jgi:hypothetical protein
MKHHKVKGVWKHRPDALPLPDAPSTGAKRKRGPLEKMSRKHLFDLAKQAFKELDLDVKYLAMQGIPTRHLSGPGWVSADCDFAEWACERLEKQAGKMERFVLELERRMG